MRTSPLETEDELALSQLATQLLNAQEVQAETAAIEGRWAARLEANLGPLRDDDRRTLRPAVQELAYAYAQRVANGDAARPRVAWIEAPPHRWGEHHVPGGRYAADNPDTIYRVVPVDGTSTYEIEGQFTASRPATTLWQVVTDHNVLTSVANLHGDDIAVSGNGSFAVTVGPEPADGRAGHLQTTPGVVALFIRDTLADWSTEAPPALSVARIAGPAPASVPSLSRRVQETVRMLSSAADLWIDFYVVGMLFGPPPNVAPAPSAGPGGIVRSSGNFDLADDEALVVTLDPAGAAYASLVAHSAWSITSDYWSHQASLTNRQAVANADGTYTFVMSAHDPGAHNWVDTVGLRRGTFLARWQGLSGRSAAPSIVGRVVPLADLAGALPPDAPMVATDGRAAALRARRRAFERRATPPSRTQ